MKLSSILGLNARSQLYSYRYNTAKGKKVCDSKIITERVLKRNNVSVPSIYYVFRRPQDVLHFNWDSLPSSFALKPSRGLGGEGIIVIKKRENPPTKGWVTTQNTTVSIDDLKLHTLDILEGAYSMGNVPDVAFVQEYVGRHKAFRKYSYRGTPDIRVIVFNKIPVMAMLRLPTKESGGRANLHQGAVGVGVDIATGITTKAIWHNDWIKYKPGSGKKLNGIKIPLWTSILRTAVNAQIASGMGYIGVDIVLHPEKGPMVLEMNAQPGLSIQLANAAGLRKRLDRVEDLEVRDTEHGVKIAKALFAARFADRVKAEEGVVTLNTAENIWVYKYDSKDKIELPAKIDTGAYRSSIDRTLAKDLGLLNRDNILWKDRYEYRSALGLQTRPVVGFKFILGGRKIKTTASVADRSKMKKLVLVGRRDLTGFLINPEVKKEE
jgi:alpha-L-glutamate ligase-like protein